MANSTDNRTPDLFEIPQPQEPLEASMAYRAEVSALVSLAIKESGLDRFQIAAEMSRLSGEGAEVSKYMLDAWSSESRDAYNMPFYQAAVLETACETYIFSNWLAGKRGGRLLIGKDALCGELGKLERIKEEANQQIRQIKKRMGAEL